MLNSNLAELVFTCCVFFLIVNTLSFLLGRLPRPDPTQCLPSGPRALPLVGNVIQFWSLSANPISSLAELTRFGELTTLWLGSCPVLLLNSPKVAEDLLQKSCIDVLETCAQSLPPEFVAKQLRTIYHDLLRSDRGRCFRKAQEEESIHFLLALRTKPFDFLHECDRFAINVMLRPMYGTRLDQDSDSQIREMYEIWRTMYLYFLPGSLPFDFVPVLLRLWSCMQPWQWLIARLKRREALLHNTQLQRLDETAAELEMSPTLASMIMQGHGSGKSMFAGLEKSEKTKTIDLLAMLLGAGSDTTSAFLQTFFKVMAKFPQAMQCAQQELDDIVGFDQLPDWSDAERLPYCRALISELHRWSPIANVGIPHATTESIEYASYLIPKNTILIPNLASLHRSSSLFEEPQIFEPARFIGIAKRASDVQKIKGHYHYGFGRRSCPGEHIAEDSLFIVITRVLWAFNICTPVNGHLRMEDQRRGLLRKPNPFHVQICLRDTLRSRVIDDQSIGTTE